jgi:hypothetical protein
MLKAWTLLLTILAIALVGYLVTLAVSLRLPLLEAVLYGSIVIKMFYPLLILAGLLVVVMGAVQLAKGERAKASPFLWMMSVLVPLASLAPAAYGLMVMKEAIDLSHTTNFRVYAPSMIESLIPLALGLAIGAIAGLSNFRSGAAKRS